MGDYTQIHAQIRLKKDTPVGVLKILKSMVTKESDTRINDRDLSMIITVQVHPFFATLRWRSTLCCDSAYFAGNTWSDLRREEWEDNYNLTVLANLKNYNDEIEQFFDWINPYVDEPVGAWIGFIFDEYDTKPQNVYKKEEQV